MPDTTSVETAPTTPEKKQLPLSVVRSVVFGLILLVLGVGIGYQARDVVGRQGSLLPGKIMPLQRENLDFSLFWQVWDKLEESYVDPDKLDRQKMVYGAIKGMAAALGDPYTMFLPPSDNQQVKEDLQGSFDGVGIQLGYKKGIVAVMSPLEGHPAVKAGVRAGDLILRIKDSAKGIDRDTAEMNLPDAVQLIRGQRGTTVTLTLYRDGKGQFDVDMVRDTIKVPSVELEIGDWTAAGWEKRAGGKVAWLKLRQFGERTEDEWSTAVSAILAAKPAVSGIVLDLRNNPGGFLDVAINLASEFIPDGVVVQQQTRQETDTFSVTKAGRLIGMPIVVLINGGSASSSEILTGALRDRLQVRLVGEKSFGKGTVQEALDMAGKAGLHVTVAKWLLPSGEWIHEKGITPDVEVKLPETTSASDSATVVDAQLQKAVEVLASQSAQIKAGK